MRGEDPESEDGKLLVKVEAELGVVRCLEGSHLELMRRGLPRLRLGNRTGARLTLAWVSQRWQARRRSLQRLVRRCKFFRGRQGARGLAWTAHVPNASDTRSLGWIAHRRAGSTGACSQVCKIEILCLGQLQQIS